jgi:hypothetical protein
VTPKGACNALQGDDGSGDGSSEDSGNTLHSSSTLGG